MFEGEVFNFLWQLKVSLELGIVRETTTGFETCITEGSTVLMAIDEVGDGSMNRVSNLVHEDCMKKFKSFLISLLICVRYLQLYISFVIFFCMKCCCWVMLSRDENS